MSELNEAVETIIKHKADLIIENEGHTKHIKQFLSERGVNVKEIPVKVFKICAVDAMIYDVGAALRFTKQKRDKHKNWTSYKTRIEMLRKIFLEK